MSPVKLKRATPQSEVKHSTTETLRSLLANNKCLCYLPGR